MTEEPWSFNGLSGTYTEPSSSAPPGPAVIILPGSGPIDRNGNNPVVGLRSDTYRMLARALAEHGIRSLPYDKRGFGESADPALREEDLRFDQYVEDATVAVRNLAARSEIEGVVLVGHSEGGLVAIHTAKRAPVRGLALLASIGRPLEEAIRSQLLAFSMPDSVRAQAFEMLDRLVAGEHVADVPAPLAPLFRPSVQPYLASLWPLDPARELADLKIPVLLVHAERDLQIGEEDLQALAAARPDARVVRLPEANHVLKEVAAGRAANLAAYANPELPLDRALVPPLVDFVRTAVR